MSNGDDAGDAVTGDAVPAGAVIEIPWQEIAPDTLDALIEEFVTRDGTDYGAVEVSLDRKVTQVREQLRRGDVVIVFDALGESVNILSRQAFRERLRQLPPAD